MEAEQGGGAAPGAMTPTQQAIQRVKTQGWGTGLPKAMEGVGENISEGLSVRGVPIPLAAGIGTAVSVVPEALQMALGGSVGGQAAAKASPIMEWLAKRGMQS